MVFPRMYLAVTESSPSTAKQSSRILSNPRSAAASQMFLPNSTVSLNDTCPVAVASRRPSRGSSFRSISALVLPCVLRILRCPSIRKSKRCEVCHDVDRLTIPLKSHRWMTNSQTKIQVRVLESNQQKKHPHPR